MELVSFSAGKLVGEYDLTWFPMINLTDVGTGRLEELGGAENLSKKLARPVCCLERSFRWC